MCVFLSSHISYSVLCDIRFLLVFFFKQKTAYDMRISDWSSDVCSSDLLRLSHRLPAGAPRAPARRRLHRVAAGDRRRRRRALTSRRRSLMSATGRRSPTSGNIEGSRHEAAAQAAGAVVLIRTVCEATRKIGRAHAELQSLMRISYA